MWQDASLQPCCDIGTRYVVILLIEQDKIDITQDITQNFLNIPHKGQQLVSAKATNVCHIMRCHRLTNSGAPTFFLQNSESGASIQTYSNHSGLGRNSTPLDFFLSHMHFVSDPLHELKEHRTSTNTTKNEWRKKHQRWNTCVIHATNLIRESQKRPGLPCWQRLQIGLLIVVASQRMWTRHENVSS